MSRSSWPLTGCSASRSSEADGGQGGTLIDAVIAIETVAVGVPAQAPTSFRWATSARSAFWPSTAHDEQKKRYLEPLLAGEVGYLGRHDRARGRIGRDRAHDHGHRGRREAIASMAPRSSPRTRRTPT